jgi:hypothetical protein
MVRKRVIDESRNFIHNVAPKRAEIGRIITNNAVARRFTATAPPVWAVNDLKPGYFALVVGEATEVCVPREGSR